jgi:hypothetical protein
MIQSLLKPGLRKVFSQKGFVLLNMIGLGIGIATVLLIFQIVSYETGFNKSFNNYDRIVRMVGERNSAESGHSFLTGLATSAMIQAQNTVPQFTTETTPCVPV